MVSYTIEGTVQNEWKRSYFKVVIIILLQRISNHFYDVYTGDEEGIRTRLFP